MVNAALYGISAANITRLKRLQNMASRITLQDWYQSSNALLRRLHWLPVDKHIEFKIACLTYKLISTEQPIYLRSLLSFQSHPRALRSSNQNLPTHPRSKLAFGERAFSSCSPKIWNRIPFAVRSALTLQTFKAGLKTYLFRAAWSFPSPPSESRLRFSRLWLCVLLLLLMVVVMKTMCKKN